MIFSKDHRPRHVHVYRSSTEVVIIELEPEVAVRNVFGMKSKDVATAVALVTSQRDFLLAEWDRIGPIP